MLTVVMLTIKISTDMSKSIFHLSVKRDDATGESPAEIQVRDYLKKVSDFRRFRGVGRLM